MEINEAIQNIKNLFENYGLIIVFLASFIEITPFGWTIPGGLIIATAAFFSYPEVYTLIKVVLAAWLGAWLSLVGGYILGKKTGYWLVKKLKQEKNATRAKNLLRKNGAVILTSSMLANLTRFWTAYIAGTEKYSLQRFLVYSSSASLGWVTLIAFIGFLAGSEKTQVESTISRLGALSWVFIIIALAVIIISIKQEKEAFEKQNENNQTK